MNGFAQSCASFARCVGPAFGGIVWAFSISCPFPYDHLIFGVIILMVGLLMMHSMVNLEDFVEPDDIIN